MIIDWMTRSLDAEINIYSVPKTYKEMNQDMPPRSSPVSVSSSNDYDVPPPAIPVNIDQSHRCTSTPSACPSSNNRNSDTYDIPRSHSHINQLTPSSSTSSLTVDSQSSSNRSSVIPDYDVPKSLPRKRNPVLHAAQLYDTPPCPSKQSKELPLELSSALENLERLETDMTSSITKLLSFVGLKWRTKEKLSQNVLEIKLSITRLHSSLHDLMEFGEGALGNAAKATDKNLAAKLSPLVNSLRRSYSLVNDAQNKLKQKNWSVDELAINEDEERFLSDPLETLVNCSKSLTEDVRQITSFIQGNGTLLFKKDDCPKWNDEYDYVRLDSKDSINQKRTEIKNSLPKDMQKSYDVLVRQTDSIAFADDKRLDANDQHVLIFFGRQVVIYHKNLMQAIDAFLRTVERNQPPKIFLAHSKFVIVSAHKLVHIGDTVHRNVTCKDIKDRSLSCANALSDILAITVEKTKQAALQFPSVIAVQAMIDGVVDTSRAATDLKMCLLEAVSRFI